MLKLTVLYDNLVPPPEILEKNPEYKKIVGHHGFSALLEFEGKKILFDAGWNGLVLLKNCDILGKKLDDIDAFILSHEHWDHAGSIPILFENYKVPEVYFPHPYSVNQSKEIQMLYGNPKIEKVEDFAILENISPNLALTGSLKGKGIVEQSLLIRYGKEGETLLLVGCAHAGLKKPIRIAEKKFGKITVICGGVHGFNDPNYLKELASKGLKKAYIGHCTQNFNIFEDMEGVELQRIYTGLEFTLE